jgi:apolipoprotein N-acyltransferase
VPVVRAANNGISAVVDSYGRITGALPLNAVAVMDLPLPQRLESTLYTAHFARIIFGLFATLLAICGLTNLRRQFTM